MTLEATEGKLNFATATEGKLQFVCILSLRQKS